ncbi:hypothetical protein N7540_003330 [Penicillium herquei]|nr:hypothetical protein N7540_003330 [Penicillium herquei]
MASAVRIVPHSTAQPVADEIPLAADSAGNDYLTALYPSQAWELQQVLDATAAGTPFTVPLAATDTTASWLSQFVNTSELKLTASVQADNSLKVQSLECNVLYPPPSEGSATISLAFSTVKDALNRQFGPWDEPLTGLEVFEHAAGLLFAIQNEAASQLVPFGTLLEFTGIHISAWARTLLDAIHLRLRVDEPAQPTDTLAPSTTAQRPPPRNGLWVFSSERRTVLRLEFELDTGGIPKELVKFLPAHTLTDLSITARKTAHFGLLRNEPAFDGELFLASQILFQVDKQKMPNFPDVKLDFYIFLSLNGTSFKIHNECKVSFADLILLIGDYLEKELKIVGVKASFDDLKNRLTTHMTQADSEEFEVHWREFCMTFSGDTLISLSLQLEVDTPFGVDKGLHSAFLFSFEWLPKTNDVKVTGRFWPVPPVEQRSIEKMPIERLLNPIDESHTIIQPLSSNAQSVINLTKLYPGFSPGKLPHWIPDEITVLEVVLSTTKIDFEIYLRSEAAPDDSPGLPFDEDTTFKISFHYTLHQPDSAQFSLEAGVSLHPPKELNDVGSCELSVGVQYASPLWTVSAKAQNVRSANLYSLLPKSVRDDIIRMMPNVYLPGLFVDYTWGGPDPSTLSVSGYMVIGGLLLTVFYQHSGDGDWGLVAKLNVETSKMSGQKTTIGKLVEDMMGDNAESLLPSYVNNVEIPIDELVDDGITLNIIKSENGPVFGFFVRIGSLHFDFSQIPGGDDKQSKRLLRLSLHSFPEVPEIPLVGKIPQPFDQVGFVWSKYDFSWDEVDHLNATLFASSDALQVKASKDHEKNPIALKKGLHFMISMNQDGSPAVVIDYVFGQSSQKSTPPAVTDKGAKDNKQASEVDNSTSAPAQMEAAESEPETGPQSEMAPIKKSHNGLSITNVGVQMAGHILTVHLNANVTLGPIEMAILGLALQLDLTDAKLPSLAHIKPTFSIDGLAISYDRNPVRISGLFQHQKTSDAGVSANTFAGGVVIGLSKYTFAAVGAYSQVTPAPPLQPFKSFFIFGALTGPLMHFEFGELRGISGGFGYNSFVNLPDVSAVSQFPFLGMMNADNSDPLQTLETFTSGGTIVSQTDSLWFAAGLKLRIFEVIDVSAVVSLQLSQGDPVLAILAEATAMVPQTATVEKAFALIDFGIIATLDLGDGTLMIQGQINPQSFLLSHACHPTGGFALCVWSTKSGHSGDMVFSVGGFHPIFSRPAHYPNPPRVGISWIFDSHISIVGGAYYAITPAAIMAGASLQALFSMDSLSAHIDAHADFLVNFEPFHYQASVGVMASVSYELKVWFITKKLSINLGADLDLHGPPMAGIAHFSFWVMSFDVAFGASKPTAKPLTLPEFWDMLSKGTPGNSNHVMAVEAGLLPSRTQNDVKKDESSAKETISIVRGGSLALGIYARVPINCATYPGAQAVENNTAIRSRPMQLTNATIKSNIAFTITPKPDNAFTLEPIVKDVPASIWGEYGVSDQALLAGTTPQTVSHTMGIRLVAPKAIRSTDRFPTLDSTFFGESTEVNGELAFSEEPSVYKPLQLPQEVPAEPVVLLATTLETAPIETAGGENSDPAVSVTPSEQTTVITLGVPQTPAPIPVTTPAVLDTFADAKRKWTGESRVVDPAKALRIFASAVADKQAFGAEHSSGMQANSGWADLEPLAEPPLQYIKNMEEYYLQAPQVLRASA